MPSVPLVDVGAELYGEDDQAIRHRLRGWGPIGARSWIAQLRDQPGGTLLLTFDVVAADEDVVVVVDGVDVTRHDVIVDLHVDGDAARALDGRSGWYDLREVDPDLPRPFTLFRRQLVHTRGVTLVD